MVVVLVREGVAFRCLLLSILGFVSTVMWSVHLLMRLQSFLTLSIYGCVLNILTNQRTPIVCTVSKLACRCAPFYANCVTVYTTGNWGVMRKTKFEPEK